MRTAGNTIYKIRSSCVKTLPRFLTKHCRPELSTVNCFLIENDPALSVLCGKSGSDHSSNVNTG